jgi:hypothetical protein
MSEVVDRPIQEDGLQDGKPFQENNPDARVQYGNPDRESMVERIAARADAARNGDPLPSLDGKEGDAEAQDLDGAGSRETIDPAAKADTADPLAEHFVVTDKGVMMKAKVDGVEKLIPFDRVKAVIQKNEAADKRLQDAALWNEELGKREAQVQQREAALNQPTGQPGRINSPGAERQGSPSAPTPDVDDRDLLVDARAITSSLYKGEEDDAALGLVALIRKTRGTVPTAPTVDLNQVTTAVRQQLRAETEQERVARYNEDIQTGFAQFKTDYPEIMADKRLYAVTDSLTEDVEKAHPDWTPSQVMHEAGKQTLEWAKGNAKPNKPKLPLKDNASENERSSRKQELRQMPTARTATREAEPIEEAQSPQDTLAEMRRARGQPT